MRRLLYWMCLPFLAGVPAFSQHSYHFPVAEDRSGPDGDLRTSIVMVNPGISTATVTIAWTNDDGSPRQVVLGDLGQGSNFTVILPPKASRTLRTDGGGGSPGGAASIVSDQTLNVWGIGSALDSTGALLGETTFAAAGFSSGFRIPVDSAKGLDAGIALFNPGTNAASVAASLFDSSGAEAGSAKITLAAGARAMRLVSGELFGDLGAFRGVLVLKSTVPIAAQALRRSGAPPVSAILEAAPLSSKRTRFYFPQLADGPTSAATLRTSFLLANLAAMPATVTLSLVRDDGAPWAVGIAGMDSQSTFQTTIPPGGSVFWQTGGEGPYSTGAASIRSDRPIAVQALVTALDAGGGTLSETVAADANPRQQFVLPFDTTANLSTGAVFYNKGTRPATLTLTLLDADGKIAGTAETAPVPPGGRLLGTISDFFPGTTILRGTLTANTGDPSKPFLSAVSVRQNEGLSWFSTFAAGAIPLAGVPIRVTSSLDAKRAVSAGIGPKGGSLSLTDAAGNTFVLTIPPKALFSTETIVMTPVTAAQGVPGSGLVAVQLEPDGLSLLAPATLAIRPAAAPSPGTLTPVGWYGANPGVYLNPLQLEADQTTLLLNHFSSGGTTYFRPGDLTTVLLNIIDQQAYYDSEIAAVFAATRAAQLAAMTQGTEPPGIPAELYDLFDAKYTDVIEPLMEIALGSEDENVILCAIVKALNYTRQRQLLPGGGDSSDAIADFLATATETLIRHAEKRCTEDHDFTALQDVLNYQRQAQFFALSISPSDAYALEKQCPAQLELNFVSQFGTSFTFGGVYKGQLNAKFVLQGHFDKEVLTQVNDPATDLFASYLLSGFAPTVYDHASFVPLMDPDCTATTTVSPSVMTVLEQAGEMKSQVKFAFSSAYAPAPYSISGVQLCSFCPVHIKKPVKVEMLLDPGIPWESVYATCPAGDDITVKGVFWRLSWDLVHPTDSTAYSFLKNWEFPASHDPYAQMTSREIVSSNLATANEVTTIKLTRPTKP